MKGNYHTEDGDQIFRFTRRYRVLCRVNFIAGDRHGLVVGSGMIGRKHFSVWL